MSKNHPWNILNTSFLVGTLVLAVVLVPLHLIQNGFRWSEWLICLAMVFVIGTAISAGYHRLFSHRAFQAAAPVRFLLLVFGAASFENSALKWSSDHRVHHKHVDTPRDPYAIQKGFWYAHWGWVMESQDHPVEGVADLEKDPMVRWQDRHHFLIGAIVALIPVFVGLLTGNFWGHFVIGLVLRIVITHHTTFFINSAAHVLGSRPYTDANTARDSAILAPLTYGEGYHNFHHMWQWDYRNGVKWYQYDSTKWLLNVLRWMGLVKGLRRVSEPVIRRAELNMEEKTLRARLAKAAPSVAEPAVSRLEAAHLRLDQALKAFHDRQVAWEQTRSEWRANLKQKKEGLQQAWEERRAEWRVTLDQHRAELGSAWEEWKGARRAVKRALHA